MILQQKIIAFGCFLIGLYLVGSALNSLRTGVTVRGRGGPLGPIKRNEQPHWFWYFFFMRIVLGPILAVGGLVYLRYAMSF